MFNTIKNFFKKNKKEEKKYVNLNDYHYKVSDIYNNMLFVDVDIDICEVEKGTQIRLLNTFYTLANKEFLSYKKDFRWRFTLIEKE